MLDHIATQAVELEKHNSCYNLLMKNKVFMPFFFYYTKDGKKKFEHSKVCLEFNKKCTVFEKKEDVFAVEWNRVFG